MVNVLQYERNGGVVSFAEFLVSLLDTPIKMQLLSDIRYTHTHTIIVHVLIYKRGKTILCPFRSVLVPSDLATFDSIVSPHEIAALQKRMLLGNRETPPTTVTTPPHSSASSKVMGLQTQTKVTPATVTRPSLSEAERREEREDAAATGREREVGAHSNDRRREREVPAGYMERGGATRQPAGSWREREDGGEEIERVSGRMMTGPDGSSRGGGGREEEEERTESPPDSEVHEVVEEEEEERRLEDIMEEEEKGEEGKRDRHVDLGDSGDGAEEEGEVEPVTVQDNYNLVLYEIQSEPILSPITHSYLFTPSHPHTSTSSRHHLPLSVQAMEVRVHSVGRRYKRETWGCLTSEPSAVSQPVILSTEPASKPLSIIQVEPSNPESANVSKVSLFRKGEVFVCAWGKIIREVSYFRGVLREGRVPLYQHVPLHCV